MVSQFRFRSRQESRRLLTSRNQPDRPGGVAGIDDIGDIVLTVDSECLFKGAIIEAVRCG